MLELDCIYIGDSREILRDQVEDNVINLHFHSPPYASMKNYGEFKGVHPKDYLHWYSSFAPEIYRTLHPNGSFILNINDQVINGFRDIYVFELVCYLVNKVGFKLYERLFWNKGKYLPHPQRFGDKIEYIFWFTKTDDFFIDIDQMRVPYNPKSIKRMEKPIKKRFNRTLCNQDILNYKAWKPNPLGALPSTLISIGSESKRVSNVNFAVFPEKLPNYFIRGATKPNDIVCDIFSGSGTTCLAAKKLDRHYIGMELESSAVLESQNRLIYE